MVKAKKLMTEEAKVEAKVEKTESLEKELASKGQRIVKLTDVTITKEQLKAALIKCGKIPGNEIPALVDGILKDLICGK